MENMLFLALVEYYDQTVIQSKFVLLINQVPIFTQNKKKAKWDKIYGLPSKTPL